MFCSIHADGGWNSTVGGIKMTRANIISEICKKTGIEKKHVQRTVKCFMEGVKNSLIKGENVYLRGFGTFKVTKRREKKGRIIKRNVTITIPERYIPDFRPCKEFVKEVIKNVKQIQSSKAQEIKNLKP